MPDDAADDVQVRLVEACRGRTLDLVQALVADGGADPAGFCVAGGTSPSDSNGEDNGDGVAGETCPLIEAAKVGCTEVVEYLLAQGAPWNALDCSGRCAGDYAMEAGHVEVAETLLNAGIQAELLLGKIEKMRRVALIEAGNDGDRPALYENPANMAYLGEKLRFEGADRLLDEEKKGVMMSWETPLMEAHAHLLVREEGTDILNVGFGLGIIDKFIQQRKPRLHYIIEAHPDVHAKMIAEGWDKIPGVMVLFGRWQDIIDDLPQFDGIFWDTWMEDYTDQQGFQSYLPKLLKTNGRFSFFNGLGATNAFFHTVYLHLVKMDLASQGYETEYIEIPVSKSVHSEMNWHGLSQKYWLLDRYFLPVVTKADEPIEKNIQQLGLQ